jgi:hypothetical protein
VTPLTLPTDAGAELHLTIRSLKVREYPAAFAAFEREEEWRLMTYCAVEASPPLAPDWPLTLTPESYERAVAVMEQENPAFFGWCVRRTRNRALRDPLAVARVEMSLANGNGGSTSPSSRRPQA